MFPILLEIGPLKLHMYGLMIAIGFLIALHFIKRDAKTIGLEPNDVSTMAMTILFLGIAGTRLFHILMYSENYSWSDPVGWINVTNGGLVFQGAIPFAFGYAYFALKKRKIPFWKVPDIAMPYVAIGQGIGRLGCLFNGCCFGVRADQLPWALTFPLGSPVQHAHQVHFTDYIDGSPSFPVHPTQIYSALLLCLCGVILLLLRKYWNPVRGFTLPGYLILTGIYRYIVEMYRGDGNPKELGMGLVTNQQAISISFIVVGVLLFIWLMKKQPAGKAEPTPN